MGPRGALSRGRRSPRWAARLHGHAGAAGVWRGRRRPCRLCAGARGDRRRRRRVLDDHERAQLGRLHAGPALRLRRAEGAVPEADGARRHARRLLPDRAAGRLRRRGDQDARRAATATAGCSTAPSSSSPRARPPMSPSSSRSPTPRPEEGDQRLHRADRDRRATASRGSSTSSASAPPTPRSSSSRRWS